MDKDKVYKLVKEYKIDCLTTLEDVLSRYYNRLLLKHKDIKSI